MLNARNESVRQPQLNLQIAKAYLTGTDSGVSTRTWQQALDTIFETKTGSTQDRWRRAAKDAALDHIRLRVILETQTGHAAEPQTEAAVFAVSSNCPLVTSARFVKWSGRRREGDGATGSP